jgi:hypothetical protein
VNSYWSPLLSWLLAPALAAGLDPLLAAKLLGLMIAVGAVAALQSLAAALAVPRRTRTLLGATSAPLLVDAALWGVFPDLLVAALLTGSAAALLRATSRGDLPAGALAGVLGGAAYLAKAYALPAFLAGTVAAVAASRLAAGDREAHQRARGAAAAAILTCAAVALPWVLVLTVEEGTPTIGTSGAYNLGIVAPGSAGHRQDQTGLLPPSHPLAVSAAEDLALLPTASWTDATPAQAARHLAGNVVENLRRTGSLVLRTLPAAALLAAIGLAACWRSGGDARRRAVALTAVTTVYSAGLVLVVVEARYLLFPALAGLAAAGVGATTALRRLAPAAGAAVLALVLAVPPLVTEVLPSLRRAPDAAVRAGLATAVGREVASDAGPGDNVPLCYRLGCRYHGRPAAVEPDAIAAELRDAGIDTYLVWGAAPPPTPGLERRGDGVAPAVYAVVEPRGPVGDRR